jgi:hypothetical protein
MNEARNYQGRVRETYRITAKSDESIESRVCPPSTSSSNSDKSEVVSVSSSRVSEEYGSYSLVNSKSLLSNDELFNMLSKDQYFVQNCTRYNISESDQALLKNNFDQYLKKYTELTKSELDYIDENIVDVRAAMDIPADNSHLAQLKTTGLAGASAYWTSFMLGKLATNFVTTSTESPHGVWPSLLIAGLLNPLVSEPLANAIRLQGAHHASPDGKAYMDFHSALQELRLAEKNNQVERINACHACITKIIDECIGREKLMSCLKSGVNEIKNEDINDLENTCGNIQQVIRSAQRRAFITDELPFFWYTLSYIAPGLFSPIIKKSFSPYIAASVDFFAHAAAGTFSGTATGISQNYLRKWIQKSTLQNLSSEIKIAQLALASAQRNPWGNKKLNLKKLLVVLEIEKNNLQRQPGQKNEEDKLEKINELIKDLKIKYSAAEKKWEQGRALHGIHESRLRRIQTTVFASGKAYMGEVSNIENPGLLEGVPAQASMCAKLIAVPLSLSLSCIHIALTIPALLNSDHTNTTNVQGMNFTEFGDIGIEQPASLFEPTTTISPVATAAYAIAGLPLIFGFVLRYQLFHPLLQYFIRPSFGAAGAETNSANNNQNDTVVNVQNTFEESEDELDNGEDLVKRSENSNSEGQSSEYSDSSEYSRSHSSYV